MKTIYRWLFSILIIGLVSCSSDDDATPSEPVIEYSSGSADFSNYVAVGNSLTAGYSDGALFAASQANSFPNLLAQQFSMAGGGEFTQPIMNDNLGGLLLGGIPITENRLYFNVAASTPMRLPGSGTTEVTQTLSGPFNNMGVPGAKSFHLLAEGYGNVAGVQAGLANPYYARFASGANASVIQDAVSQNPSFFTLWIGNNDVLGYAISGGTGVDQTGNPDPSSYGSSDISDPNVFAQVYSSLVGALAANGAKGIVSNIPNVTTIPYLTTVPYNPVPLDEATAGQLNAQLIGPVKQILTALGEGDRLVNLVPGDSNPLMIQDEDLTDLSAQLNAALQGAGVPADQAGLMAALYGQARHATESDLITLPTSSIIGAEQGGIPAPFNTIGVTYPLRDNAVLIPSEQAIVTTAVTAYNETISAVAGQNDLAVVDANTILNEVAQNGVAFDEFGLNGDLVFGGIFSLDGIHLTARGNAFVANKFIDAIEAKYNAVLPRLKAVDYNIIYPETLP
ncbi:G-D-S-L family lipolytic protein [Galbibacter sp. EGI 63066]|uniref:G-D-S-L family lipolytic protein n=1 Tax=Galbibacter sp. EGI 63066 TaxID=2993559 RepID=UPI002249664A|nr:G-D-S-L family lipolytic protein [Galbibacter sp. EGI 63066]MCX2680522.1 G-D-S-L family lipolytic protein [Galbibacter sp. EGI 63066]